MKRIALLFVALCFAVPAQTPILDYMPLWKFNQAYAIYFRKYFGCPLDGMYSMEMCHPSKSVIDANSFKQARDRAKILFGLK